MLMSINYVCRFCRHQIGQIQQHQSLTDEHLGFHTLSDEERQSIISYEENGDIQANVVCEHCQETIERNPELLLQSSILQ
jgi:Fe-S-cluster-containing hydrogenase component 2